MSAESRQDDGLGKAVELRRIELGLKRRELAERAHLSYPYISEIENGVKEPSAKALRQIAEALEMKVAELAALSERLEDNPPEAASIFLAPAAMPFVGSAADSIMAAPAISQPLAWQLATADRVGARAEPPLVDAQIEERVQQAVDRIVGRWLDALPALVAELVDDRLAARPETQEGES